MAGGRAGDAPDAPDADEARRRLESLETRFGEEVRFLHAEACEPFESGWGGAFHGRALAVARPQHVQALARLVGACAEAGLEIVPQGGNTGMAGGCTPSEMGTQLVISLGRMNRIRDLDAHAMTLEVEAGCILADVRAHAARAGLLFPLSLGSQGSCCIGGLVATNAGGVQVIRYGNMRRLTLGLEVVLPDGRIWNGLRALPKDNAGYDLKQIFIGSEGTLGLISAAILQLAPAPDRYQTALLAVPDLESVLRILAEARQDPALHAFELMPGLAFDLLERHLPHAKCPLRTRAEFQVLLEFARRHPVSDLPSSVREDRPESLETMLERWFDAGWVTDGLLAQSLEQATHLWYLRESLPEAVAREGAVIRHDVSIPLRSLPALYQEPLREIQGIHPGIRLIAFGHPGDGNIHFNLLQPVDLDAATFRSWRDAINRIVHGFVVGCGGSISAEHGIGTLRRDCLPDYKDPVELDLMRRVKQAIDPQARMNPGKIFSAG